MINEIDKLVETLNHHTKLYNEGNPVISDKEWDDMYFKLVRMEKESGYVNPLSPTVSFHVPTEVDELKKVVHDHPMLSLDKTKDYNALIDFAGDKEVVFMSKADGLTCSLKYEKGILVRAETRGDGYKGEDVTHCAYVVASIPNFLPNPLDITIDGEVVCRKDVFEKNFAVEYANTRNFASGSIRLLNSEECKQRQLSFYAWDIIGQNDKYPTLSSKLDFLSSLGFNTVNYCVSELPDATAAEKLAVSIKEAAGDILPIDGVVVKYNDCAYYESLGTTGKFPRGGIAFKFYDESYPTILRDIEWTMGRTGVLTPVAIFDPVQIEGASVARASLHTVQIMRELYEGDWTTGMTVYVYRANQINPQISEVEPVTQDSPETVTILSIPEKCPICGEPTIVTDTNNSTVLKCSNHSCSGRLINRLDHFCGKAGLDIRGLSVSTLEKLVDYGWVDDIADLYELKDHRAEWIKKSGFGPTSVDKILAAIESSKNTSLPNFISAIGIPLIGTRTAKEMIGDMHISTWDEFYNKVCDKNFNFCTLKNIGVETDYSIKHFNYSEILKIAPLFTFEVSVANSSSATKNSGLTFCVTGSLKNFKNRNELVAFIENKGGKVVSAVSSKTNYLVNNDINSTSSKNAKAKSLNIPIITEDELLALDF